MKKKLYFGIIFYLFLSCINIISADTLIGKKAPNFSLTDINGNKHNLKNFRGKIVLLNIWTTWCHTCRKYMPKIKKLNKKYSQKGLKIISVNIQGKEKNAVSYIKKNNFNFLILFSKGNWASEIVKKYNVNSIPILYLIDKNGIIRYKGHPARFSEKLIQNAIENKLPDINAVRLLNFIIEFEKHVKYTSQKLYWRSTGRRNWLIDIKNAETIINVKELLISLEESFLDNEITTGWQKMRDKWLKSLKQAKSFKKIAELLPVLFKGIRKSAFEKSWTEKKRKDWLIRIQNFSKK